MNKEILDAAILKIIKGRLNQHFYNDAKRSWPPQRVPQVQNLIHPESIQVSHHCWVCNFDFVWYICPCNTDEAFILDLLQTFLWLPNLGHDIAYSEKMEEFSWVFSWNHPVESLYNLCLLHDFGGEGKIWIGENWCATYTWVNILPLHILFPLIISFTFVGTVLLWPCLCHR